MRVKVRNSVSTLVEATEDERDWVRSYLSFDDESKAFRRNRHTKRVERVTPPKVRLFDRQTGHFPTGVLPLIARRVKAEGGELLLEDARTPPLRVESTADLKWLRPYQLEAVRRSISYERGILHIATGGGKCLGFGTPVLHYDGRITAVEDVVPGDLLMGPNSGPRRVLSTTTGRDEMFRITPNKGEPWICNAPHVLTLVHTVDGNIVDVPLNEWLGWNKTAKHCYKLFQPEVISFNGGVPMADLPIDPYFLGLWFGDGRKDLTQGVQISKPDAEIETACRAIADQWGLEFRRDEYSPCPTYRLVVPLGQRNPLLKAMRNVVGDGATIPPIYLTADIEARRELLAGLVDTDGHVAHGFIEIIQKRPGVADGIEFLARSLGFRTTRKEKYVNGVAYQRVNILGEISTIRTRIPRKQAPPRQQVKNALRVGFKVEAIGPGDYAGFTLDGDGRFLLGDFTVTHNTEVAIALTRALPCNWLFVVHRAELMHQTAKRWKRRFAESLGAHPNTASIEGYLDGDEVGIFGDGEATVGKYLTVATFQTLHSKGKTDECRRLFKRTQGLIVDECFPAGTEIGGVPVESLTVGDYIPSYNPTTKRVEAARIGRVFVRPARELVRLRLSSGESVVCTPNHPLMTPEGYQPAATLAGSSVCYEKQNSDVTVCRLRKPDRANQHGPSPCGVLPGLQKSSPGGTPQSSDSILCTLRDDDHPQRSAGARTCSATSDLLRGAVSQRGVDRILEENRHTTGRGYTGAHDCQQPNEPPRDSSQGVKSTKENGTQTADSRGQWETSTGAPTPHGACPRLESGACHTNKADNRWHSKLLQGGLGQRGASDRGGDRRAISRSPCQTGSGSEKDKSFTTVRVESVEVLQPGSNGKFGGLCSNGFVYNFHVPGNETYLVGNTGIIAHNCHTLPSTTFFGVAMQFHNARYRIGLSGTPLDRDDKRSFMAVGALGPVIHRLSSEQLVETGVLARPLIRMVELEQEIDRPTYQGVYGAAVVRSGKRNKLISRIVAHHAAKPSVVFYKELSHGRQLQEALERRGLRVGLVAGSTPVSLRQSIAEQLARGDLDVVVASVVWQEGIDIPELRSLVIATAGKSIIATLQRAGRGTRRTKGKSTFELWDVFDSGNQILHRHATARRGAYEREGFKVSVLTTKQLEGKGKS